MYKVAITTGKIYLLNTTTGEYLKELTGQPKEYPSVERAEFGRDYLNTPVVSVVSQRTRGVMDNRHRNWKRRTR